MLIVILGLTTVGYTPPVLDATLVALLKSAMASGGTLSAMSLDKMS